MPQNRSLPKSDGIEKRGNDDTGAQKQKVRLTLSPSKIESKVVTRFQSGKNWAGKNCVVFSHFIHTK
jgi:hypothetical protein